MIFSGYIVKLGGSTTTRIVRSYDPKTGKLTLDKTWFDKNINPESAIADLYLELPTYDYYKWKYYTKYRRLL